MFVRTAIVIASLAITLACGSDPTGTAGIARTTPPNTPEAEEPAPADDSADPGDDSVDRPWVLVETISLAAFDAGRAPNVWEYDALNQLVSSTERYACRCVGGEKTTKAVHEYSEATVVSRFDEDVDGSVERTVQRTRDEQGRWVQLEQSQEPAASYHSELYGYDSAGRLISIDHPQTPSLYSVGIRDAEGRLTSLTQAGEEIARWRYGDDGLLVEKHSYLRRTLFEYDNAGRLIEERSFWDGAYDGTTQYDYDPAGRLVHVIKDVVRNGDGAVEEYEFAYDDSGRLFWRLTRFDPDAEGTEDSAAYDEQGRLVRRGDTAYEYRSVGSDEIEVVTWEDEEARSLSRYRRLPGPAVVPPVMPSFRDDAEEALVAWPAFPDPRP